MRRTGHADNSLEAMEAKEQGTRGYDSTNAGDGVLCVTRHSPVLSFTGSTPRPFARLGTNQACFNISLLYALQFPGFIQMSALTSGIDSEQRFAAQAPHRQSQSLQSNHTVHQHLPLPSDRPFPAHSQLPSNPMIGPTAPAAPYDPNVYPSYPPPERHQQDYEHFIMTQLSASTAINNQPGLSAHPPANNMGRPPQAIYSDNTIERMVQRDPYVVSYGSANPQALLGGGGYAMQNQNQNIYAPTSGPNYTNGTNSYPDNQASGGMYTYDPNLLLSPDSIHSIESPPMMMQQQQGPGRSHTMPSYYSPEVPFSQIVARNNTSSPQTQAQAQNNWVASSSPPNPNYNNTSHFPVARSTAAAKQNGQQIQAVRKIRFKIK